MILADLVPEQNQRAILLLVHVYVLWLIRRDDGGGAGGGADGCNNCGDG